MKKWPDHNTELLKQIFFKELLESVEYKGRVSKTTVYKIQHKDLPQPIEIYGANLINERLYSLKRGRKDFRNI